MTLLRDSSGWQLRAFDPKPHRAPPPTPPHSTANRAVHQAHDLGTAALRFASLRSGDLHPLGLVRRRSSSSSTSSRSSTLQQPQCIGSVVLVKQQYGTPVLGWWHYGSSVGCAGPVRA